MSELHVRAILAGVLFGAWPLLMNKSGLSGNISSTVFAFGALAIVLPFGIYEFQHVGRGTQVGWALVTSACIMGGLGLLAFNGMLAKADPKTIGSLFVFMIVVQVATPALYQVFMDGGLTIRKTAGFVAAILAALLLV